MMATTLMEANQNSNSPNDLTEMMLVSVSTIIRINAQVHWGTPGTQRFMMRHRRWPRCRAR